jgi:engulfment and cell motility protein 1
MVRVTYRKKMTPVDPESNFSHAADLRFLWETSKLQEEVDENGDLLRWRNLGFDSEDIEHEFNNVGVLGLECLVRLLGLVLLIDLPHLFFCQRSFVQRDADFSKVVLEQLSRPRERRCPIGKVSNEVVELLSEHWAIFAPGCERSGCACLD